MHLKGYSPLSHQHYPTAATNRIHQVSDHGTAEEWCVILHQLPLFCHLRKDSCYKINHILQCQPIFPLPPGNRKTSAVFSEKWIRSRRASEENFQIVAIIKSNSCLLILQLLKWNNAENSSFLSPKGGLSPSIARTFLTPKSG